MPLIRKIWDGWKRIGRILGDFIARLLLTVFYFTVMVPFGLAVRVFMNNTFLGRHLEQATWEERFSSNTALDEARRLY